MNAKNLQFFQKLCNNCYSEYNITLQFKKKHVEILRENEQQN